MKTLYKILWCVCGLALFPLIVSAANNKSTIPEYDLKEYQFEDLTLPIPDKVVKPRVNGEFAGSKVRMDLIVGKDGRPRNIHQDGISMDSRTNDLASTMKMVLRAWRFQPGLDKAGNPVAVRIILPVEVVSPKRNVTEYATIALAKPIFLARVN